MRLIDADALGELFDEQMMYLKHGVDKDYNPHRLQMESSINWCRNSLNEAKTIDAEPVRHGRWIPLNQDDGNGNYYYSCSCCHSTDLFSRQIVVNYCWNCGAKMDEVSENDAL